MDKIRGKRTGEKNLFGLNYVQGDDNYFYIDDGHGTLHETAETTRLKRQKEEEKRQREAKPGFFDDLPSLGSILARNLAEEEQKRAAIKAREKELFNSAANTAVNVGGILLTAAKVAGHADNKPEPPVRSDQEYMDMFNKLYGKRK